MGLDQKIAEEYDGILTWLVEGCLEWQRVGLQPSERVLQATRIYRQDSDPLDLFIAAKMVRDPEATIENAALYKLFREWAQEEGEFYVMAHREVTRALKAKGFEQEPNGRRRWRGLCSQTVYQRAGRAPPPMGMGLGDPNRDVN